MAVDLHRSNLYRHLPAHRLTKVVTDAKLPAALSENGWTPASRETSKWRCGYDGSQGPDGLALCRGAAMPVESVAMLRVCGAKSSGGEHRLFPWRDAKGVLTRARCVSGPRRRIARMSRLPVPRIRGLYRQMT